MPEKKHISEVIKYSKLLLLQAIRVFLLMRDLCLALLGKNEEHLPLSKVENSVHLEDVLDLSKWKVSLFLFTCIFFLIYWFGWYWPNCTCTQKVNALETLPSGSYL